jgi:S-formylglutathione hydrolase
MSFDVVSQSHCFGGTQFVYRHKSSETGTSMRFSAYVPPQAAGSDVPVVWFLAGLTCTEETFILKAGAQRLASELGLILVSPDTSPRGEGVPGDPEKAWDFGLGAGFYVDAVRDPWATHYHMRSYIERELPALVGRNLPADMKRQGISGHSMGGHGAITIALRNPGRFRSVSAFAPIASPANCPWGEKALSNFLSTDRSSWWEYDSCSLIERGARLPELLVDQGNADPFIESQLKPHLLEEACAKAGQALTLRRQPGYDHSYFFVASFIEDHLRWHAARLG